MKIVSISVENFKILKSIKYEPKLLNVIIGGNDTGKTSFLQAISVSFDDNVINKEFADFPGSMINFEAASSLIKVETKGKNPGQYIVSLECPDYEAAIESFSRHFREFIFNSNKFAGEVSSRKNPRGDDISLYHFVPVPDIEYIRSNIRQSELTEKLRGCLFIRRDGPNVPLEAKTYLSQDVWNLGGVLISYLTQGHKDISIMKWKWEGRRKNQSSMKSEIRTEWGKRVYRGEGPLFIRDSGEEFKKLNKAEIESLLEIHELEGLIRTKKELATRSNSNPNEDQLEEIKSKLHNLNNGINNDARQFQYQSTLFIGDGMKTLLGLMDAVRMTRPGSVLLLDDVDLRLSSAYLKKFIKYTLEWCRSEEVQFFMTARNTDIIRALVDIGSSDPNQLPFLEEDLRIVTLEPSASSKETSVINFNEARKLYGE